MQSPQNINTKTSTKTSTKKNSSKIAQISLIFSIGVLALKYGAYLQTKSVAVMSDATESIVNVVAALSTLFIMRAVAQPADKEHPYGHGKLEYFSAAFEGGLIAFASLAIMYESIQSLIYGEKLKSMDLGVAIMVVASIINAGLALYLKREGKKNKSEALLASGAHVLSDVWTTVGVVVGLAIVYVSKWWWLDPLVAIGVSFHLGLTGYGIIRKSVSGLLDEVEPNILQELAETFQANRRSGFIDIHQLKIIRSGNFHHVDAHLVVPEFWDIQFVHEEIEDFEKNIIQKYSHSGELAFHLDPCCRKYCKFCDLKNCIIRQKPFEQFRELSIETLVGPPPAEYLVTSKMGDS